MKRLITLGIIFIIISSIVFITYVKLNNNWNNQVMMKLEQDGELFNIQLRNAFNGCFTALTAFASLFELYPHTDGDDFNKFAESLISEQPSIRAFQFADSSTLITYVYPENSNEITIREPLILLDDPDRAPITRETIRSRNIILQDPFLLRQGGMGTVARFAIYDVDELIGLVIGVIDIKILVESILPEGEISIYNIRLKDEYGKYFYESTNFTSDFTSNYVLINNMEWEIDFGWKSLQHPPLLLYPMVFFSIAGIIVFFILIIINKSWLYTQFLRKSIKIHTGHLNITNIELRNEIEERKKITNKLAESEEKYKGLINSTIDGVIAFDSGLNILLWNPAAEKIYGYTSTEMIGTSLLKLVPERYYEHEKSQWKDFWESEQRSKIGKTIEMLCLNKGGRELPIEFSFAASYVRGQHFATAIVRNIAERKERELALINSEKMLNSEVESLRKQLEERIELQILMGDSSQILKIIKQIEIVAPTMMNVIIQGESGTGKEIVANMIHEKSNRALRPFIAIDCGAIPSTLFESELFGYEKGTFTGAEKRKTGKFEEAKGGTLFFDEISNLTFDNQAKLLRVLQEREFYSLGGSSKLNLDVRVLIASNINLFEHVKAGKFRDDLFHRLNQFSLSLPDLSDRLGDIPILVERFIQEANLEFNKNIKTISQEVLKLFMNYKWPGNVRELKNIIRRAVLIESSSIITIEQIDLKGESKNHNKISSGIDKVLSSILNDKMSYSHATSLYFKEIEKEVLHKVLELTEYNRTKASNLLMLNRKTLYTKLKDFEIDV